MRVLVTGAFGFVGTAVVHRLVEAGHEVVGVTSRPEPAALPRTRATEVRHADIRDIAAMREAVAGVDAVCHLAALTRVRESFDRPDEYHDVNANGTYTLAAALRDEADRRGWPLRFVQGSTAAIYGAPQRQPIDEQAPLAPANPYGVSKAKAEEAVRECAAGGQFGAVILRAFNVAGAVDGRADGDRSRIIPRALTVARGGAPHLEVNGDGSAVRDFVHVLDLARAYELALGYCSPGRTAVFNVGATEASVADIIAVVERLTGRALPLVHRAPQPEPARLVADVSRLVGELGWRAKHSSLDEMIGDAWAASGDA
jgi:UDP-glucose 4-epimerase